MAEIGFYCPIFSQPCIRERCIGYYVHSKEVFKDTKLSKFVPIDDLEFYRSLPQSVLDERFDRIITITRECKLLGTLIEKEEIIDHNVPNPTPGYYT